MAAVAGLVDITIIQRNQLGEAQTTGVKKLKQGLIPIGQDLGLIRCIRGGAGQGASIQQLLSLLYREGAGQGLWGLGRPYAFAWIGVRRSEEHTSELQSRGHLVCRLLLEKKNKKIEASAG